MSRKRKQRKDKAEPAPKRRLDGLPTEASLRLDYDRACRLAVGGQGREARRQYDLIDRAIGDPRVRALIANDRAALAAHDGDLEAGRQGFLAALALDEHCDPARANLALLKEDLRAAAVSPGGGAAAANGPDRLAQPRPADPPRPAAVSETRTRVAILSLLFNWPTTGGGNVHTYELALFLARAGYDVRHVFARFPPLPWRVGEVPGPLPYPSEALVFDEPGWHAAGIQERFRQAVAAFRPDHVIITDSWNFKPLLAEAVQDFPYILRFQAMECLCPLNNVRLLPAAGGFRQCPQHQLANPDACARCLQERARYSGPLHQAERALSGVGTREYHERLLRVLRGAEAVLVVNPLHGEIFNPYNERVQVVTAGMDPARFPWPPPDEPAGRTPGKAVLFFAGLIEELMKGFNVLHAACARLWQRRRDFELVATGDPPGRVDEFTRFVGWQSQDDLPRQLRAADVLVMPTVAQEALGRTAVEAMAAGKPVVASRLGGLPFTVADGATGLLCEPGNPDDLARKLETLLDDPELRRRLGQAGRRRFEEHYSWEVIIPRHYVPLLGVPGGARVTGAAEPDYATLRPDDYQGRRADLRRLVPRAAAAV